jgi:hypothetical protein
VKAIDQYGHLLLMEDVGNQAHISKIWQYTIVTDSLIQVGTHDPNRFITGASEFLTQDEESSGMIDVQSILGQGMFLVTVQAHYPISGEAYEGGQLLAFFNPDTYHAAPKTFTVNGGGDYCFEQAGALVGLENSEIGIQYQLKYNGSTNVGTPIIGTGNALSFGIQSASGIYSVEATNTNSGVLSMMLNTITITQNSQLTIDAGSDQMLYLGYGSTSCVGLNASNVSGGSPGYTLWWNTLTSAPNITVCPSVTTDYVVSVRDNKGCKAKDSVKVCTQNVICDNTPGAIKITICHNGTSLCVAENEVAAHLSHGDYLGLCGASNCDNGGVSKKENIIPQSLSLINSLTAYPNPANSNTIIEFSVSENTQAQIGIYDMNGKLHSSIFNHEANQNIKYQINLNTSSLKDGVYIVKMKTLNDMSYFKLVVTH